jgi:hypothetical protein
LEKEVAIQKRNHIGKKPSGRVELGVWKDKGLHKFIGEFLVKNYGLGACDVVRPLSNQ